MKPTLHTAINKIIEPVSARPQMVIIFVWAIIQIALYVHLGLLTNLESDKYVYSAEYFLRTGALPETRYIFYSGIILLISLGKFLHLGIEFAIVAQLAISLFAHLYFYRTLRAIGNSNAALITTLALCLFWPFQAWNLSLYSESLFYSSLLLFFTSCIRYQFPTLQQRFLQLFFLILVILCRPMGILLLPCWILLIILQAPRKRQMLYGALLLVAGIILWFITNTILSTIGDWKVLDPAENNFVICGIPEGAIKDLSAIKGSPIDQLATYITTYPADFLKLSAKRFVAFFTLSRSYYGLYHNLFLWILCLVLYLPILLNIRGRFPGFKARQLFAFSIILLFLVAVCLQCDDYHNRFHNAIVPVFLTSGLFVFLNNRQRNPSTKPVS